MGLESRGTVLVVDDDRAVRHVLRSALERLDYRVVESTDGVDALRLVESAPAPFTAIISDIGMPRLDGIGLVEKLGGRRAHVPVILTSGRHTMGSLPAAVRARIAGFIAKPYSLLDVVTAVKQATGASRGHAEAD